MMYSKRHLLDIEQRSQSSGSNVIPRRARPGLAGPGPYAPPPNQVHAVGAGDIPERGAGPLARGRLVRRAHAAPPGLSALSTLKRDL